MSLSMVLTLNTNEIISYFDQLVSDEDIDSYSIYFEDQALIISETGTSTAIVRAVNPQRESNVNIIDDNIISGFYSDLSNEIYHSWKWNCKRSKC